MIGLDDLEGLFKLEWFIYSKAWLGNKNSGGDCCEIKERIFDVIPFHKMQLQRTLPSLRQTVVLVEQRRWAMKKECPVESTEKNWNKWKRLLCFCTWKHVRTEGGTPLSVMYFLYSFGKTRWGAQVRKAVDIYFSLFHNRYFQTSHGAEHWNKGFWDFKHCFIKLLGSNFQYGFMFAAFVHQIK